MIQAHCPRHGGNVFVPMSQIEAVHSIGAEHVVRWRCTCGTRGTTSFPRRALPL